MFVSSTGVVLMALPVRNGRRKADRVRARHNGDGGIRRRHHERGAGVLRAEVLPVARLGFLELESDIDDRRREITYARVNYLAKRWNLESAQANVFVWGGAGQAYVSESNEAHVHRQCGSADRL